MGFVRQCWNDLAVVGSRVSVVRDVKLGELIPRKCLVLPKVVVHVRLGHTLPDVASFLTIYPNFMNRVCLDASSSNVTSHLGVSAKMVSETVQCA